MLSSLLIHPLICQFNFQTQRGEEKSPPHYGCTWLPWRGQDEGTWVGKCSGLSTTSLCKAKGLDEVNAKVSYRFHILIHVLKLIQHILSSL